jgi:hypothetical protein
MSAIMMKMETETVSSHSTEMLEWVAKCIEGLDRLIDEIHVPVENVLSKGLPVELTAFMENYWATLKDKNMSEYKAFVTFRHIYEQVDLLQKEYCSKFKAGKMHYYIYYIAYRFSLEVMDEMNRAECALTKTRPSGYRKWMDIPSDEEQELIEGPYTDSYRYTEWGVIPPEWAQMDDEDQEDKIQGYQDDKDDYTIPVIDDECKREDRTSSPSLYRFDPEIPMTDYLQSEEDAKLFMEVMFINNECRHSEIVPDRLYNYLPEILREIVDLFTETISLGQFAHETVYSKFKFDAQDEVGVFDKVEKLSSQLTEYINQENELPFAYVYVAKFILTQMDKVLSCSH